MDKTTKPKKVRKTLNWAVMISAGMGAALALFCIGLFVWNGFFFGMNLCQKPGTPLIWMFTQGKDNRLHALGNPNLMCGSDFQPKPKEWQPFALSAYHYEDGGICLKPGVPVLYNLKQGASGNGGSYRLDIPQDRPFFQDKERNADFHDPKIYCDETSQNWCHVVLVPVCEIRRAKEEVYLGDHPTLSLCNHPEITAEHYDDSYGVVDGLAAIMIKGQKGWGEGFRYSLSGGPLIGGIAVAEGLRGEIRCYYRQNYNSSGHITTHDQAVQACMSVLTDRNHYCRSREILPSFSEF